MWQPLHKPEAAVSGRRLKKRSWPLSWLQCLESRRTPSPSGRRSRSWVSVSTSCFRPLSASPCGTVPVSTAAEGEYEPRLHQPGPPLADRRNGTRLYNRKSRCDRISGVATATEPSTALEGFKQTSGTRGSMRAFCYTSSSCPGTLSIGLHCATPQVIHEWTIHGIPLAEYESTPKKTSEWTHGRGRRFSSAKRIHNTTTPTMGGQWSFGPCFRGRFTS
jgi:hypothetical protein